MEKSFRRELTGKRIFFFQVWWIVKGKKDLQEGIKMVNWLQKDKKRYEFEFQNVSTKWNCKNLIWTWKIFLQKLSKYLQSEHSECDFFYPRDFFGVPTE